MSIRHRSHWKASSLEGQRLAHFSITQHHYGIFIGKMHWQIYGCGTYKQPRTEGHAKASLHSFLDQLERRLGKTSVACIAALENSTSGLGYSPAHRHWHFLMAAPKRHEDALLRTVPLLWEELCGNCKTEAYDSRRYGASYLAKTVKSAYFDCVMHNLDRLYSAEQPDLFIQQQTDPHFPDHARGLTRGDTLAMRPAGEGRAAARTLAPTKAPSCSRPRNAGGSHGRVR